MKRGTLAVLCSIFRDLESNAFLLSFHQHHRENGLTRLFSATPIP